MIWLWLKAAHVIAMVAWFAGLFYLPRLFVYHVEASDEVSLRRFVIMERRLYYGIMWPAAIATLCLGLALLSHMPAYYLKAGWMHAKLLFVGLLLGFHLFCGHCRLMFVARKNPHGSRFYRFLNECPTVLLIVIVVLVVVR
ncbi:MAG: protoporphyrinogen oxidase HemJ [Gammaproteobacteria bacterium]|nr:protoporphyrinogen oxidase HemJ [Gammaproteobacteria bacterium]